MRLERDGDVAVIVKRASESERFRKSAASEGLVVTLDTPASTAEVVHVQALRWRKVVVDQSIRMD